ncbi:MAG: aldehyde dehydrogenase family protein [Alphaproteobacteria bacterium]
MGNSIAEIFDSMDYGPAPESDSEARAWIAGFGGRFGHYIDGEFTKPSKSGFESVEPATGAKLARISQGSAKDVDKAVKAATKAQKKWADLSGHQRAKHMYALARMLQKHGRLLAVLESLDNGKSVRESRDADIPLAARHFYHHAGWAQLLDREFPDHEPLGVVGQVIPWNFPLLMLAWKIAPALAAGNTVVLKPAEYTPLTALAFADLCHKAGLPKGVVNIVTGDGKTGAAVVDHSDIAKLAFTGSTDVGRIIRKASAGTGKKLTLELGGKSPFIVFDDADIDSAIEGLVDAIWFNQGQVCCGGSRLLVQESIEEEFITRLKARMDTLRVGHPLDKAIDIGAIVDPVQVKSIQKYLDIGVSEGAEMYQPSCDIPGEGCFIPPTLFTGVDPASTIAQEEIFGPVLSAISFRTPADAVAIANNTRYGLAASIWSENINLALDMAPKLAAGVVWINSTNMFDAACGFGGIRESGYGREGGREGMLAYLKPKWEAKLKPAKPVERPEPSGDVVAISGIDRTAKMYVAGKQKRPDGNYNRPVHGPSGEVVGEVGEGNRKDIRDAVEAAIAAGGWSKTTAHLRAQILYYIAENLDARRDEFAARLRLQTGVGKKAAEEEVDAAIARLFSYGAWADKYDGAVHQAPVRFVTAALNEPVGVIGIACPDENPLLSFISLMAPAIAMGNRVVMLASEQHPLSATDFYQVLETSDLPGGVVNIITGDREALTKTLADHAGVDSLWHFGTAEGATYVEDASADNLKRTWCSYGKARNWMKEEQGEGREFLEQSTEVKNVWIPYGE